MGKAVVSTSLGAEGLEVVDGKHLFIADRPGDFAGRGKDFLKDNRLRKKMGSQGRDFVINKSDWKIIGRKLNRLYSKLSKNRNKQ